MVFYFFTRQLRHRNWVHLGRRGFTVAQQFPRIFTVFASAAKIFTEASRFELHFRTALIALDGRALITANFVFARLKLKGTTIWIVAAQIEFRIFVDQIFGHGGLTGLTAALLQQDSGLFLVIAGRAHHLIARDQINRLFAALLWRQVITRAA